MRTQVIDYSQPTITLVGFHGYNNSPWYRSSTDFAIFKWVSSYSLLYI